MPDYRYIEGMTDHEALYDQDKWGSLSISAEVLQEIRASWENEAGTQEFKTEMGIVFNGIAEDLNKNSSDNEYLVLTENDAYRAILEIIDTRQGQMTKLLTLHLSPTYWDEPSSHMLTRVYTEAVATALALGGERATGRKACTHDVKIYGRSRELLDILRKIDKNWTYIASRPAIAQMEGRWLRITLNSESY